MITLKSLSDELGLERRGCDSKPILSVGTIASAQPDQITFLANPTYRQYLETTQAAAVILSEEDASTCSVPALIAENPYATYARVAAKFAPLPASSPGIHGSAVVARSAQVDPTAAIGPHCVIEDNAVIGAHCTVGPRCVVGAGSRLGSATRLVASVTILHDVVIGKRTLIHPGAVIGSDGFGLAMESGSWLKVPQLGSVHIGDDCEIGANSTIDRGALEDTVLGNDVRLDNLVQIAHNVRIGDHSALAGCAAVAGSAVIGQYCMIGGRAGVLGHLELTDRVTLTAMTLVTHSIRKPGTYSSGTPLQANSSWRKNAARFKKLDDLARRIFALERKDRNDRSTG